MSFLLLIAGMVGLAAMYPLAERLDQWLIAHLDRVVLGLFLLISSVLTVAYLIG